MSPRIEDLKSLEIAINEIGRTRVFEYLSRWSFERLLDDMSHSLSEYLKHKFPKVQLGCSILYRAGLDKERYVLGGSSQRRTRMDPTARYYELLEGPMKSFTGWSLRHARPLVFDDFQAIKGSSDVQHQSKSCELPDCATKSYLTIPWRPDVGMRAILQNALQSANVIPAGADALHGSQLPSLLLRITFAEPDYATRALKVLDTKQGARVLKEIFLIGEKGIDSVQLRDGALAIADLNADLLRYCSDEYGGLEELAFHLQTLFGECECSIFLAQVRKSNANGQEVRLGLAATTALSPWHQHQRFRQAFFEQQKTYVCKFVDGKPAPGATPAKTERAYYFPDAPVYERNCRGQGRFKNEGEYDVSTSFLALAIPARQRQHLPYGVIRIVRGKQVPFDDEDRRLAAAIAKNLTYWLEFFPRNDALSIAWEFDPNDTLRILFSTEKALPKGRAKADRERKRREVEARIEFQELLRKIFAGSTQIRIKKQFEGRSGAVVLLVENDSGLDLILKCASTNPQEASNIIVQEVENYRNFVEGKLALNHTVIYPDLIRQMPRVAGFATSFLGSNHRNRMTLRDYVVSDEPPLAIFSTIRQVASKIVEEIWHWWYQPRSRKKRSSSIEVFVTEGLPAVRGWHLSQEGLPTLDNNIYQAKHRTGHDPSDKKPSSVYQSFMQWAQEAPELDWEEAVTHGDLHGGNIFFDPHSMDIWLIDFARTGRHASISDLALLESNIKLQLLPLLLKDKDLVKNQASFLRAYTEVEVTLASQNCYGKLPLPNLDVKSDDKNKHALEALHAAVRAIIHIRELLHQCLGRRGDTRDYRIALYYMAYWYMNVRGASVHPSTDLQVLMAHISACEQLDSLVSAKKKSRTHLAG
jgi:hypothetical protein